MVLDHICSEVRESGPYSVIVDEASDISRNEQVAIYRRYITDGMKLSSDSIQRRRQNV